MVTIVVIKCDDDDDEEDDDDEDDDDDDDWVDVMVRNSLQCVRMDLRTPNDVLSSAILYH